MNGWRCRFATGWFIDGAASEYGEITGFDHPNVVWVVLDGEDEPRRIYLARAEASMTSPRANSYLMVSDAHEDASPACHAENGHSFVRVEIEEARR
jgi:hypothetical protein